MDKYFIISVDPMGTYFEEHETYQEACQSVIDQANYRYPNNDFETCEIIKGRIISSI